VEGLPISVLCDELGLQPTVFYRWQKEFFENGAAAFQRGRTNHQAEQERIAYLEKPKSIPTNRRITTESYSAYSTAGSDRLNHCCKK
jgi:transposase-like protein